MVFQNYALYPHMTVYKNMALGLELRHIPRREIDEKIRAVAAELDISYLLNRKPRQLSGGQRQRWPGAGGGAGAEGVFAGRAAFQSGRPSCV